MDFAVNSYLLLIDRYRFSSDIAVARTSSSLHRPSLKRVTGKRESRIAK